jgi:hypothetical protein
VKPQINADERGLLFRILSFYPRLSAFICGSKIISF